MSPLSRNIACFCILTLALTACDNGFMSGKKGQDTPVPQSRDRELLSERGKITGEGLTLFGGSDEESTSSGNGSAGIGVNSFLWRATLDTLAFMPLASADPFGGVVLTDWYEDPAAEGERFKINALILSRKLRADAISISLFKQTYDVKRGWRDANVDTSIPSKLEDAILTRARELRVQSQ